MKFILLALILLSFCVNAEKLRNVEEIDIVPAEYGKYGITPIVGPISTDKVVIQVDTFNNKYKT
jgi:hypothetical protein